MTSVAYRRPTGPTGPVGLRKYYRAPPYFEAILQTESVIFRPYLGTTGILSQWRLRTDPTNVRRRTWYFRKYYRRFCRTSVIFPMGWYGVFALKPSTSVIPYLFWRRNVLFVTHMILWLGPASRRQMSDCNLFTQLRR